MYKIRFNLGAGKNFMKWKVTFPDGKVKYYEPSDVVMSMYNCKLVNHKKTATRIFNGENKTVCAWITSTILFITPTKEYNQKIKELHTISYNPRVAPHWVYMNTNVDGRTFDNLVTCNRTIYHRDRILPIMPYPE